jgi:hypothetical protein
MGSISLGTMSLGEQQKLNALVKKELLVLCEFLILNERITILVDNSLSFSVLLKLAKLVTPTISLISEQNEDPSLVVERYYELPSNLTLMLSDWSDTDLINFTFHY